MAMQSYLECNLVRNLKRNYFTPFVDVDNGKYFQAGLQDDFRYLDSGIN